MSRGPSKRTQAKPANSDEKVQFVLELRQGGGFRATALGQPLSAEGRDLDDLHRNVTTAVRRHFGQERQVSILAGLPIKPTDN